MIDVVPSSHVASSSPAQSQSYTATSSSPVQSRYTSTPPLSPLSRSSSYNSYSGDDEAMSSGGSCSHASLSSLGGARESHPHYHVYQHHQSHEGVQEFKSDLDVYRERVANMRALKLLDEPLSAGDRSGRHHNHPRNANGGSNNGQHGETGAVVGLGVRLTALMTPTQAAAIVPSAPASPSPSISASGDARCETAKNEIQQFKSDLDVYRERGANMRALELFDDALGVCSRSHRTRRIGGDASSAHMITGIDTLNSVEVGGFTNGMTPPPAVALQPPSASPIVENRFEDPTSSFQQYSNGKDGGCDDDEMKQFKSDLDLYRERDANLRAQELLDELSDGNGSSRSRRSQGSVGLSGRLTTVMTPGQAAALVAVANAAPPSQAPLSVASSISSEYETDADENNIPPNVANSDNQDAIHEFKSNFSKSRERGAGERALNLLNRTFGGDRTSNQTGLAAAMSGRQVAIAAYEQRQKEKAAGGRCLSARSKERLAESNRKGRKAPKPEDVQAAETVAGMKSRLDKDREKQARTRALKLLELGFLS